MWSLILFQEDAPIVDVEDEKDGEDDDDEDDDDEVGGIFYFPLVRFGCKSLFLIGF